MATKGKAPVKRPAKKNGYEMPKPLKAGDVLKDTQKGQWKVGVSIGAGGFGEIYSACDAASSIKKVDDYPFVVKIEPKGNGPLFVEMHFYIRCAKQEDIDQFKKSRGLKTLGMPRFVASGSHEIEDTQHRFVVLPRFGQDIWKLFLDNNRLFPLHTVYRLGVQLINILEYIHHKEYVHADVKGANILLGFGKGGDEQVYLLDFGLASHYTTKDFKPDPKKMHNGTIEYTSRDAHQGVPTMRSDIEILAYNLVEWAGGKLPWVVKNLLAKPVDVQKAKMEFMESTDKSLKSCFGSVAVPTQLKNFLKYLESIKYDTKPDYAKIRGMFETGIKELGKKNSGVLEFSGAKASTAPAPAAKKDLPAAVEKKKAPAGRPNFENKLGDSPRRPAEVEPVKRAPGKRKVVQAKYVESDSEEEEEVAPKKKSPMKAVKAKKAPAPEPVEDPRPNKRNRAQKQYVPSDSSDDEAPPPVVRKSPPKKLRAQPTSTRSTSKENQETSGSSVSPPQKKTKSDENLTEKTPKNNDRKKNAATGSIKLSSTTNSSKNKKTIQLNFDLNVSLDSDVVVTVNRKEKKDKEPAEDAEVAPNRAGVYKGKHAKPQSAEDAEVTPDPPNRAGVYKGKHAKPQ